MTMTPVFYSVVGGKIKNAKQLEVRYFTLGVYNILVLSREVSISSNFLQ